MTQQERNKQIALMLDWEYDEDLKIFNTPFLELVEPQAFGDEQFSSRLHDYELKFHSDWNWLIEAVEFVEKNHAWVNIKGCLVDITKDYSVSAPSKKEAVFLAVSDFAKLYNENKL